MRSTKWLSKLKTGDRVVISGYFIGDRDSPVVAEVVGRDDTETIRGRAKVIIVQAKGCVMLYLADTGNGATVPAWCGVGWHSYFGTLKPISNAAIQKIEAEEAALKLGDMRPHHWRKVPVRIRLAITKLLEAE